MTTTTAAAELMITVSRKGEDTGIWHVGTDADDLIAKAQQSVSDAFGDGKRVLRLARRDRNAATGTLVINHSGVNYGWELTIV